MPQKDDGEDSSNGKNGANDYNADTSNYAITAIITTDNKNSGSNEDMNRNKEKTMIENKSNNSRNVLPSFPTDSSFRNGLGPRQHRANGAAQQLHNYKNETTTIRHT